MVTMEEIFGKACSENLGTRSDKFQELRAAIEAENIKARINDFVNESVNKDLEEENEQLREENEELRDVIVELVKVLLCTD